MPLYCRISFRSESLQEAQAFSPKFITKRGLSFGLLLAKKNTIRVHFPWTWPSADTNKPMPAKPYGSSILLRSFNFNRLHRYSAARLPKTSAFNEQSAKCQLLPPVLFKHPNSLRGINPHFLFLLLCESARALLFWQACLYAHGHGGRFVCARRLQLGLEDIITPRGQLIFTWRVQVDANHPVDANWAPRMSGL